MNAKCVVENMPDRARHRSSWCVLRAGFVLAALLAALPARANAPSGRYVCDGIPCSAAVTMTVVDAQTGLQWQRAVAPGTSKWTDALTYCEGLTLAGFSDWRLPAVKELSSIVDVSRYNPPIDSVAFPLTAAASFWSSSPSVRVTGYAWIVNFDGGATSYGYMTGTQYCRVRCVR